MTDRSEFRPPYAESTRTVRNQAHSSLFALARRTPRYVFAYALITFAIETYWSESSHTVLSVRYCDIQSVTFKGLVEVEDVFQTVVQDITLDEDGTLSQRIMS